jgi:hypothetical protein
LGLSKRYTKLGTAMRWNVRRSALVHAVNAVGRFLGPLGSVQFEKAALLEEARRQTGLDDFGSLPFQEPLQRLLASIESEATLNPIGQLATRQDLIRILVNRLQLEKDRKSNPAIAEQKIPRPIMITGLPRTGTTLLHRLLALDPANRVPFTWETLYPSPPPEAATCQVDPRIRVVERQLRWFQRLLKDFNKIHPIGARLPEECLVIFSYSFLSYQFETTHRLPSYLDWLLDQDLSPAYEIHRRILQNLQWRCPGERWVLKAPAHMFDFEALFSVYPDACIVMTHRDPVEVTASNASLTATLRSAFSDEVNPFEVGPECSRRWAIAINRAIESRDTGRVPAEHFLDVFYSDLTGDPVGTIKKVYASFELPFPDGLEERIREFLRRNPKDLFGKHRYSLEEFGLNVEEETSRYAAYRQRFRL